MLLLSYQTLSEQTMSTVNISHLGTDAEVQLAEALVAVSEAVVAAAAEGDDTPRVVAVEETTHSEDDAVMQQVCVLVLSVCKQSGVSKKGQFLHYHGLTAQIYKKS